MQISLLGKRTLLILGLIIMLAIGISGLVYYQQRRQAWLEHKKRVENQKAPEMNIRIVEGWNINEIASYLEKQGVISSKEFLNLQKNYDTSAYPLLESKPPTAGLEGFLFPDTYRIFEPVSNKIVDQIGPANSAIKKMLDNFQMKVPENAEQLAKARGLKNFYEALILASIVENETGRNAVSAESKAKLDEERGIVAGIFYNRLNTGVALQSDATINYITGKNDPAPALSDLEIESPYNTYRNRGLTPTPIGNPSLSSIMAVLNPTDTEYFYFLHKQPSGEPVYSKTFEEHVKNKQKYLK